MVKTRAMKEEQKNEFLSVYREFSKLGIKDQVDFMKFHLYSIITHSTAIEGSTITENENMRLFENGNVEGAHNIAEYFMNIDLKNAYMRSQCIVKNHPDITESILRELSGLVMRNTGSTYYTAMGEFSSSEGDYRKVNVRAGLYGPSYMGYEKIPYKMKQFCEWLNAGRKSLDRKDVLRVYELSFDAHYNLVTIHPWVDGNGRMSRLLMNYIQMENEVLPVKVTKSQKEEYIRALNNTREAEDLNIFRDFMFSIHINNMREDIVSFKNNEREKTEPKLLFGDNTGKKPMDFSSEEGKKVVSKKLR